MHTKIKREEKEIVNNKSFQFFMNQEKMHINKIWRQKVEKGLVKEEKLRHVLENTHQNLFVQTDKNLKPGEVIACK